jgi:acyl-CoA reductase-like NAD-dependent aldehyde dehydrogenase
MGERILRTAGLYDEVTARMVELAEGLKVGSAMDFESDMGPLVVGRQFETVTRYIQTGQDEGAKLLTGGGLPAGVPEGGHYAEPTIF